MVSWGGQRDRPVAEYDVALVLNGRNGWTEDIDAKALEFTVRPYAEHRNRRVLDFGLWVQPRSQ